MSHDPPPSDRDDDRDGDPAWTTDGRGDESDRVDAETHRTETETRRTETEMNRKSDPTANDGNSTTDDDNPTARDDNSTTDDDNPTARDDSNSTTGDEVEEEWRFGVDDVGPETEAERRRQIAIEPERVSLEHAIFVVLGVVLTLLVILTAIL